MTPDQVAQGFLVLKTSKDRACTASLIGLVQCLAVLRNTEFLLALSLPLISVCTSYLLAMHCCEEHCSGCLGNLISTEVLMSGAPKAVSSPC